MANPILAVGTSVGTTGTFTGTANTFAILSLLLPAGAGAANPAVVTVTMTGSNGQPVSCGDLTPISPRLRVDGAGTFVVTREQGNCGVDQN